jgi:hypothetical protein
MIGLLFDVALYTGHWVLNKTYNGMYYMYYGSPKDPVITRLNEIENQLKSVLTETTLDHKYYWSIKSKYSDDNWLVISDQEVLYETKRKTDALRFIADREDNNANQCLLVQINHEEHMYII